MAAAVTMLLSPRDWKRQAERRQCKAMREVVQLFHVAACVAGLAACGYPALPDLGGPVSDAPSGDAAPPPQFLSCAELPSTCGATADDSCCTSLPVPGGGYYRSYDQAGDSSSGSIGSPASVSELRLDKYEVTVGRFRAFVKAGMGTQATPPLPGEGAHAKINMTGWDPLWNASLAKDTAALITALSCQPTLQPWTDAPGPNEDRPMSCLTWYEAMAFCAWDGGYLPTEAEWNYAAAGGDQQRAYPWSNPAGSLTIDSSYLSYFGPIAGTTDCAGDGMLGCKVTDMLVVGSKPKGVGRWGQLDLAGNVWEWTFDGSANYVTPCPDCVQYLPASSRVVRGGSFDWADSVARTTHREARATTSRTEDVGVRCARAP